jgi:hypothetical protein
MINVDFQPFCYPLYYTTLPQLIHEQVCKPPRNDPAMSLVSECCAPWYNGLLKLDDLPARAQAWKNEDTCLLTSATCCATTPRS